jgi:hypothetical protein
MFIRLRIARPLLAAVLGCGLALGVSAGSAAADTWSLRKIPTTSARRPISLLTRSSGWLSAAWSGARTGSCRTRSGPDRRSSRVRSR